MMKKKKFIFLGITLLLLTVVTACSRKIAAPEANLPKADVVLSKAQNTDFKSMHATWLQTDSNHKALQKAEVRYHKDPQVIYADFTTSDNHYLMWIDGKYNYMQSQGTATKRWFKTKLGKNASYSQLTSDLAQDALMAFSSKTAKMFNVRGIQDGYALHYQGNSKKMWNEILDNTMITSVIGIDENSVKPGQIKIEINTDKKYNLTKLDIDLACKDENKEKHIKMVINQINKLPKLEIPSKVKKSAVDLGSLSH